jgi:gamma-D-glutamyl-L-lysine dipeptidyl-peptidase
MSAAPHHREERPDATVRAPVAPVHSEPKVASPQISQLLAGARVEILEACGDWLQIRGPDGYEGWMNRGYIEEDDTSISSPRLSLGCTVRDADGQQRFLPLGARVAPGEKVISGEAISERERRRRFPADPDAIVASGIRLFEGASYLWGGVTPQGADCSGFTQSIFALHGITLPRDAWQQAQVGEDAGRNIEKLRAADLMFFSDRDDSHITHVGIATGNLGMVHLALGRGGYRVERLDEVDDPYVQKVRERFLFGRRVL